MNAQAATPRAGARPPKEPPMAQIGSFVDLFVWLLVLKSFFLPLFIIPTGSMAETLAGAHSTNTCVNCGYDYMIGPLQTPKGQLLPDVIQCPNCRLVEFTVAPGQANRLEEKAGDRIMVHGWPFALGGFGAPQRWDVVVFKNPNEPDVNFIKRLIAMPGETVELINGDVFVIPPGKDTAEIVRKTPEAQESLWFPYYQQDYLPREAVDHNFDRVPDYLPQWIALRDDSSWNDLRTRRPVFDGVGAPRQEILFTTATSGRPTPAMIMDHYGYNSPRMCQDRTGRLQNPDACNEIVSDVRLSTDVRFLEGEVEHVVDGGSSEGTFELVLQRFSYRFVARLTADGSLSLWMRRDRADLKQIGETVQVDVSRPVRLSLGHADGTVTVAVDGAPVLESGDAYQITPEIARQQERPLRAPVLRMAGENVRVELSRVQIDRDVHYRRDRRMPLANGVSGNPLAIPADAYYVLGDNSPASQDSRLWTPDKLGPHLIEPYEQGRYTIGTVPARDMIGKAFLVYWPGFLPPQIPIGNLKVGVLDLGRVRWIN